LIRARLSLTFAREIRSARNWGDALLLCLPSVALGELYFGAYRSGFRERQLNQLAEFVIAVSILDVGANTADHYGTIKAQLAEAGTPIPENDIWIAALAREYSLPIVTRDRHFSMVSALTVLAW
jgi:tRNA(fMet)-specific endonuclease VapC